jgi:hypothetical protein
MPAMLDQSRLHVTRAKRQNKMESIITDAVPWLGLLVALGSLWYARRAYSLADRQDRRALPSLGIYLEDNYILRVSADSDRIFAILIMVSNRSDSSNAMARIELEVIYSGPDQTELPLRLNSDASLAAAFPGHQSAPLLVPSGLPPRQTLKGWCYFKLAHDVVSGQSSVLDQTLLVTDTNGAIHQAKPDLLNEISVPKACA